jgi:hypothetical protein
LIDMATVARLEPHVTIKKPKAPRKRRDEDLKLRVIRAVSTADLTGIAGMVKAPAHGVPRRLEDFDPASLRL